MSQYDSLFEPLDVGGVTIPNRIVRSPHGTGLQGEALIAYHEARARGGVGMSTLEATGVHPGSPTGLPLYSDSCIGFYQTISKRMAPYGMKLLQQIYHGGAGLAAVLGTDEHWSASPIVNPLVGVVPVEMTQGMIDEVVQSFALAARRCRDGGLDGVDVHGASGYLIHEFLSPATNHRNDQYGGSVVNRTRFLIEVLSAIRAEIGAGDFIVGVRLPNEDHVPGGLKASDNAEIARLVEPLVDYVSLHMGAYWRFHKLIAPADDPLGLEMDANRIITAGLTKPTMVVGRIMTLDHADHIVRSGEADMVSMVRALIADPDLVNKARRGNEHLIRPCVGSNMGCVGKLMSGQAIGCVVNVAVSNEARISPDPLDRVDHAKKLLVVGGGPAGMEFARTACLRGHQVELHEAMQILGGQVTMAARAPRRADLGTITTWLADELERLGVAVHLNSMVDEALVTELQPDEVIIATGSAPRSDGVLVSMPGQPVPGFDRPHVYNAWDLLGFGRPPRLKGPALVYDDTGSFEAISVCDLLLEAGLSVTLVSRVNSIGENLPYPPVTAGAARERLYAGAFDFIGGHYLREIGEHSVNIGVLFTDRSRRFDAAMVVLVGYNQPNRDLLVALGESGYPVHQIGDVRGRNSMMNAIHAGAGLGRKI